MQNSICVSAPTASASRPRGRWRKLLAVAVAAAAANMASAADLELKKGAYFSAPGADVLVFSNWYDGLFSDSKISGVEIIHHGERTVTNGDVRLHATPEQWDPIPTFVARRVASSGDSIEADLSYPDHNYTYTVRAERSPGGVTIKISSSQRLPEALAGRAGFNLEFLPSAYFGKSFQADQQVGLFPLYPTGIKEQADRAPEPLASGQHLSLAPDDPSRAVRIQSKTGSLALYDGRTKAQNGWFVVRELLPANAEGTLVEWQLEIDTLPNWHRPPVIAHSQVGYHPTETKVAVLETDPAGPAPGKVELLKVGADGKTTVAKTTAASEWGDYTRYRYYTFDFSEVTEPGIYKLRTGNVVSAPFPIGEKVYEQVWHPTLGVFLPVQMDHMLVNEAYRVWHGASHLDDARQAPINHEHFDLFAQGPSTETKFKPGEHIPGLNVGGWFDAGDFDIRTQTQYHLIRHLVHAWEDFKPEFDRTAVDYSRRYVDIHVPDGKPDLLQQIAHGTLQLVAQHRVFGRAIPGIVEAHLSQYTHLGDAVTKTDGKVYDPKLGELETDGDRSGIPDDRWAFTSHNSALNYGSIAGLAAAARVLQDFDPALAKEALEFAVEGFEREFGQSPKVFEHGNTTGGRLDAEQLAAAGELLLTTGDKKYVGRVLALMPELEAHFGAHAQLAVRLLPAMPPEFRSRVASLARQHESARKEALKANPFGVEITEGGWAGNGRVIHNALNQYYLHRAFPELIDPMSAVQGLNYLFGTHPHSDISFVSAVGAKSKQVAYGNNRADFSFIAGGIVPGVLILKPDYPENKEDWPFFWGQNEYVVNLGGTYIQLSLAVNELLGRLSQAEPEPTTQQAQR